MGGEERNPSSPTFIASWTQFGILMARIYRGKSEAADDPLCLGGLLSDACGPALEVCMDDISTGSLRKDLESVGETAHVTIEVIMGLPDSLRRFIQWIARSGSVTCEQAGNLLGESERDAQSLLNEIATLGLIEHTPTCGVPVYRVCFSPRRLKLPPELSSMLSD